MKKDLNDMLKELLQVWDAYHTQGTKEWNHEIAAQDLPYQVGSLSKLVLQLNEYRYSHEMSKEEIKGKIGDELADILAEVIFIAHGYNIDIMEAWKKMLESDKTKIQKRGR